MKYLSLSTVENSFKNSVVKTQIEFWTLLGVLQSIDGEIKSGVTYKFLMAKTTSFLGKTFTLSDTYHGTSEGEEWYAKFGTQWTKEISTFIKQGKVANIYELAIWALRKEEFDDDADISTIVKVFAKRFHFPIETLMSLFSHETVACNFDKTLYSDTALKDFIKDEYTQNNDYNNLKPDGSLIVNSADIVQSGAFVKPYFNKVHNNRCLMITTFNIDTVYSGISKNRINKSDLPLQKIVYGAPGTGKSFGTDDKIKEIYSSKEEQKANVFRTTFHPDSDYSTFVGAYKPTTSKTPILNQTQLIKELNRMIAEEGAHALDQFAYKYWESFEYDINKDALLQACGKANQSSHLNSGIALGKKFQKKNNTISYSFVPQTFTKAYIQAWKNYIAGEEKPVFLVIEEINRGNCAQIFGDLFQLLDRDDETGMSCYPIKPDTDLGNYIADELSDLAGKAPDWQSVIDGEELILPNNLHIWATMNTSDQSLFPIDSAFKRRWKWEYVKIKNGVDKKTQQPLDWTIKFGHDNGECNHKWWDFIQQINKIIASMTSSADKQLGYFFCKPDKKEDGAEKNTIISEEAFVGKVVFYLWNDVFKNYAMDEGNLFKFKAKPDAKDEDLTFPDFYDEEGKVNGYVAAQFIEHVMAWEKDKED